MLLIGLGQGFLLIVVPSDFGAKIFNEIEILLVISQNAHDSRSTRCEIGKYLETTIII